MPETNRSDTFAVVDLGSNSFHMKIAHALEGDEIHDVDRLRERVRLAAGLIEDKKLSDEALRRAFATLRSFFNTSSFNPHRIKLFPPLSAVYSCETDADVSAADAPWGLVARCPRPRARFVSTPCSP